VLCGTLGLQTAPGVEIMHFTPSVHNQLLLARERICTMLSILKRWKKYILPVEVSQSNILKIKRVFIKETDFYCNTV
jgi:hypothetical protein